MAGFGASNFVGLLEQTLRFVVIERAEHDHTVAMSELGVVDCAGRARDDEVPLEPEDIAQPRNG
jgi:hypothetical protein